MACSLSPCNQRCSNSIPSRSNSHVRRCSGSTSTSRLVRYTCISAGRGGRSRRPGAPKARPPERRGAGRTTNFFFNRSNSVMDTLLQDIRYALRVCARTPGLTAVAILALALGIGANTAIFTIVNAVLLQRLPFRDSERIIALWEESTRRPGRHNVVGPSQFLRWSDRATVFERMALLVDIRQNLTGN